MRKLLIRLTIGLAFILIVIQLIPVEQKNPPVTMDIPTSPEVKAILKRGCYDCHSNEVVYPWYSRIAPVSWLVAWDVAEGRDEVNFSTWQQYSAEEQAENIHESWEAVAEGEMPFWYYTLVHRDARLLSEERQLLEAWAREVPLVKEKEEED